MTVSEWLESGNARYRAGDPEGAMKCYQAALDLDPHDPRSHYNLGLILQGRGQLGESIAHYQAALLTDPEFIPALVNCANALASSGDYQGAIGMYQRALELNPEEEHARRNLPAAHYQAGLMAQKSGRFGEADASYRAAIEANPGFADAWVDWGVLAYAAGDRSVSLIRFQAALKAQPDHPRALHNLATMRLEAGEIAEAKALYQHAIEVGNAGSRMGFANALAAEGQFAQAIEAYESVISANGDDAVARQEIGRALHQLGRLPEALRSFERAYGARKGFFQPIIDAATVLAEMGRLDEARTMFARALDCDDPRLRARANLGIAYISLHRQDFEHGWPAYENRLDLESDSRAWDTQGVPRLTAGALGSGKRVAVWREQGIGDQVLFSTLIPELVRAGLSPMVQADRRLVDAFRRSVPGAEFVSDDEFAGSFAECHFQVPLGSLPGIFRSERQSFSRQPNALLVPDARRLAWARSILEQHRPVVAIAWRSLQPVTKRFLERSKSASLEEFSVLEKSGATLIDLQYGDVNSERAHFDARHPGLRRQMPGLDSLNDLEGVLAAIAAGDLVITTSNVTAHLAGALGKRTWLVHLGGNPPFHYWVRGPRHRSLWYPSVEVVSSADWMEWGAVFAHVARRLEDELSP